MDTVLLKTFLEVVACNSFAKAADRLFVTQSAVSLRIKSLEEKLGRTVFQRSKAGIKLTPAGQRLIRHAHTFIQVWEEARHQVAVPEEYNDVLVIAAETGLWERLLIRWLSHIAIQLPNVAFRVEEGRSVNIMRQMVEGITDIAVLYTPQLRPGIDVLRLFNERIVLVSTDKDTIALGDGYIYIDWSEEFTVFHTTNFPEYEHARFTFRLGHVTLNYLLNNGGSAYIPLRLVQPLLDKGKLFLVKGAAEFDYPVHVAWRTDIEQEVLDKVVSSLREIVKKSRENSLPPPFWLNM